MMTTMLLIENVIKCFVRRRRRSRLINSPAREGRRLEGGRESGARLTYATNQHSQVLEMLVLAASF